jgi:hypothetical protein
VDEKNLERCALSLVILVLAASPLSCDDPVEQGAGRQL